MNTLHKVRSGFTMIETLLYVICLAGVMPVIMYGISSLRMLDQECAKLHHMLQHRVAYLTICQDVLAAQSATTSGKKIMLQEVMQEGDVCYEHRSTGLYRIHQAGKKRSCTYLAPFGAQVTIQSLACERYLVEYETVGHKVWNMEIP